LGVARTEVVLVRDGGGAGAEQVVVHVGGGQRARGPRRVQRRVPLRVDRPHVVVIAAQIVADEMRVLDVQIARRG